MIWGFKSLIFGYNYVRIKVFRVFAQASTLDLFIIDDIINAIKYFS